MRLRIVPLIAVLAGLAVALVACGSGGSDDGGSKTTDTSAAQPAASKVTNDYALAYTGGRAGAADASATPITIGYINQEGGVPSFPEATIGVQAAVDYVNAELGGAQGHPIKVKKCLVQTEEDGQRCATEMANDSDVSFVIEGQLAVGNKAVFSVLGGKKPIIESSPSTIDDLTATDAYAYTPGGPGVIAGMAIFTARLPDVRKVAVLYADNPAGKSSAEQFLKPLLLKLGVRDVTLVGVADNATGPDLATAIQAAGGDKADTLVSFLTVLGCIATYDALKSLGVSPRVVATGLCFGTPMTQHLKDIGSDDPVPDGWYFGAFGYSYFQPDEASGMTTYLAKIRQYGPPDVEYTGFAGYLFADVMTGVKLVNQVGADNATPDAMRTAMKTFRGPMMLVAGPMKCGYSRLFAALCGSQAGIEQYEDGQWIPSALATTGRAISVAQVLGG
jgi:branched-chain amino acid transport system substrate-binding protein